MRTLAALLIMPCLSACVRPEPEPALPRLEPGVILTTPEGAYIIDLLWLKTGEPMPEMPAQPQFEDKKLELPAPTPARGIPIDRTLWWEQFIEQYEVLMAPVAPACPPSQAPHFT